MNLDTLVKQGCMPWTPAPGVHGVDIWHEYDIPTIGTFRTSEGNSVLFTLVGEPDDRLTVWAYKSLSSEDAAKQEREPYDSTTDLDESVGKMFVGRHTIFALADDLKIIHWTPTEVGAGVLESATEFLRGVRSSLASTSAPDAKFRAELAGVEVETTDLVDA